MKKLTSSFSGCRRWPRLLLGILGCVTLAGPLAADPLSRRTEIDFFRDVPSRNLKGLAARSDGRLVAGPTMTDLSGSAPADLLWCMVATSDPAKWILGTGPDGRIFEATIDFAHDTFSAREIAKVGDPHVFALARLPDGALLAGTSPRGGLCLVRDGKLVTRVGLPVDSVLDVLLLGPDRALVSTGNPGRVYAVDLKKFASAGIDRARISDAKLLADRGLTLFTEIRDRNVRRLARLSDGRIVLGSSPKGDIYTVAAAGGAPVILQENRDGEVTDLLPAADGGFHATVTFASGTAESRVAPPKGAKETSEVISAVPASERFTGRSVLLWFPPHGYPETLAARSNTAFYALGRFGDTLVVTGGEQGEMLGYDVNERMLLTFAGSASSQLNGLAPIPAQPGRYLVLRNNAPGLALLDFHATTPREAETRRIDLGAPSLLGALRFNRLRHLGERQVTAALRTSYGSDEVEGWGPWVPLQLALGGWSAADLHGRYVKLRLTLPADSDPAAELDKAALFSLPQNHRPQLQEFHLLSPNYGLVVAPELPAPAVVSVGQVLQNKDEDIKRKAAFLSSQIVPQPGAQVVIWNVTDPDGDNVVYTFSLRREGDAAWTDVALNTHDTYVQFDISHLPDGIYFTRLVATETDPRPVADRLSATFETDDLVIDHTPPEILDASVRREGDRLVVQVHGRDALSLVDGIEINFNNGVHEQTEQPVDGIRDSREETFAIDLAAGRVAGATAVDVTLYDAVGNSATKHLTF